MLQRIHHINFVVNDLDRAVAQYEQLFGLNFSPHETLNPRGVKTARTRLGQVWLVLVEPTDPNGVPGRHLAEHGEGFFLISYKVDDVTDAAARVRPNASGNRWQESRHRNAPWRRISHSSAGAEDSQVADLPSQSSG